MLLTIQSCQPLSGRGRERLQSDDLDRLIPDDEHPERPGAPQFLNWRENLGSGAFAESARVSENVTRGNTPIFWDSEIKRGEYGNVPSLVVELDKEGDQEPKLKECVVDCGCN